EPDRTGRVGIGCARAAIDADLPAGRRLRRQRAEREAQDGEQREDRSAPQHAKAELEVLNHRGGSPAAGANHPTNASSRRARMRTVDVQTATSTALASSARPGPNATLNSQ